MKIKYALITAILAVLTSAITFGQTFRGGISGIVTDQTGAIVPGAELKAANEATGLNYTTTSSSAGRCS